MLSKTNLPSITLKLVLLTDLIVQVFGGLNKYGNKYGLYINDKFSDRYTRPTGVATEVYNQVLSVLSTQCMNLNGRFVEYQSASLMDFYNGEAEALYNQGI